MLQTNELQQAEDHSITRTRALVSSYVGMVGIAVAVNTPPVCLTAVTDTFLLTETERGVLLGALFWGFVAAIIVTGPLGDRFGYKPFLVCAAVLQVAGLVVSAAAPSYEILLAGAALTGVGSGVLEVLVSPLVCTLRPEDRTRAMNVCHGFYSVGAVGTLIVSMYLLRLGVSWRIVYAAMVVPPLLYGIGYLLSRLPGGNHAAPGEEKVSFPWRSGLFWLMVFTMLLVAGTEIGPAQWIPAYLEDILGFERQVAPVGLMLFSAMMAAGRFAMGHLSTRYLPLQVLVLNCLCCAACLAVAGLTHSRVAALASFGCLGLFVAAFWPTVLAYCADRIPKGGISMFGALSAVGNAGGIVFPTLVGWLGDHAGLRAGIGALALLPVVAGAIFAWALVRGPERADAAGGDGPKPNPPVVPAG